ncbi:unnamed protein product [Pedinophyceae sp. YPF-701]|nr:unnamed protein product [Pedinophyceae sp. YPF-701]
MDKDRDYDPNAPDEEGDEAFAEGAIEDDDVPVQEYESADEDDEEDRHRAEVARKERERLKKIENSRKAKMDMMHAAANKEAAAGGAARSQHRLHFLMRQAEIFQHFAPNLGSEGKKGGKGKKSGARGHRGEHGEADEDAELLAEVEMDEDRAQHRLDVQPKCIKGGEMRPYQMQGLNWMIHLYDNGINGILADEMGLGKTLQTISLLGYLREFRGIKGPHLVVVPKSTLGNWMNEFRRWCPDIRPVKFHGTQEQRAVMKEETVVPGRFDVCVTSYEMVIKERNHFKRFHWRYIIIDEAHRIKNVNSRLSQVVRLFKTNYRMLITGTPLQNNLRELWALLNFLVPEVFTNAEKFEEWFQLGDENESEVVQQLHKLLRPFLLRRLKSDVEKGLPPKKELILKIGLTEMQKKQYAALLQKDMDAITGGAERSRLLNIVMQLRKCCNHPYLFEGAEPGPPYLTGEHLVENSGKMVLLDRLLPKLQSRGSRVLIFSQMTRVLDILEDYALYRGYKYSRIDGNTSGDDRENAIDSYNAPGSEKFIFLLSTRAGGLGINLTTADTVVLYDSDWNPQMDLQAMDRAHRIGQTREVSVYRFCTEGTIEEKVIEKAYKKLRLDAMVIQQGRLAENTKSVNKDELLSMVRYGAELIFSSKDSSSITDEDIDAILARGEQQTKELNDKMAQFTEQAMKFSLDGDLSVYEYKDPDADEGPKDLGVDLKALIAANWVEPAKRERKKMYNETEYFRQVMGAPAPKKREVVWVKRVPLNDFQFFDRERAEALYAKEEAYLKHRAFMEEREEQMRRDDLPPEVVGIELEQMVAEAPPQLTDEERAEREEIISRGFRDWTKRDFQAFVRGCERYGRNEVRDIAREVEGKSEAEVRAYHEVFWKRFKELDEWERILKAIERGEARIQRHSDIARLLRRKVEAYGDPLNELRIAYGPSKGKAYTEEEDRFILCAVNELGYGRWEEVKAEIRRSWRFRFDWFIKSRSPQELARRCDTLIRLVEKELEDEGGKKRDAGDKSTAPSGPATAAPSAAPSESGKKRAGSEDAGGDSKKVKVAA